MNNLEDSFDMNKEYDYLLVGAGLFNATFAYMARQRGKRCIVIEKRKHLGGNVYCEDVEGITVHKYGPHIFHTDNREVWKLMNSFTSFNRFTLNTVANFNGQIFNLPFNMNTFNRMWGVVTPEEAEREIRRQVEESGIVCPKNLEEMAISLVGRDIFHTLIEGYTEKQWERPCRELPAFIIKRLPVRLTYDNNYFNDRYQGIPDGGYNRIIEGMLVGVECLTGCDYFSDKAHWDSVAEKVVYSGAIDEYFGYRFGHLEYRSLRFEQETLPTRNFQGNAIVNYTSRSVPYTRIVEHKHFDINNTAATTSPLTVITREHPQAWQRGMDAYYPINDERNQRLYRQYKELADMEQNVIFGGRLAEYKYYDMDDVVESAMRMYNGIFT